MHGRIAQLSMTSSNIEKVVDGLAFGYLSEGDI
jgi:hypothetical protein